MAIPISVIRSARFCLFRAYTYPQRRAKDCSEHRQAARATEGPTALANKEKGSDSGGLMSGPLKKR
jgi:hypothetical protein